MKLKCKICGDEKDIQDFNKAMSAGPLEPWNVRMCKACAHDAYLTRYAEHDRREAQKAASRDWKRRNPGRHAELARQWRAANADKVRAVNRLNYALRMGRLVKRPCEACGATDKVHAHHDSYAEGQELNVRWLCTEHHKMWHQSLDSMADREGLDRKFFAFCSIFER